MKVSVFGLGYVGAVTAACLARDGHFVVGVDVNPAKVAMVGAGESPIVEPGLGDLLATGVSDGSIRATSNTQEAVLATDLSIVSVGTPPTERNGPDLSFVFQVCQEIGAAIRLKGRTHVLVIRSTVPPGTLARCQTIVQESADGIPVHIAFNPEFLREGSALKDYWAPPYTIIGTEDTVAEQVVRAMYSKVDAPVYCVEPAVAEMVKYVANAWHATKVTFGNEVGRMAKSFGVDGRQVMDLIVQDTKLNISPVYLRPGFAYGGSCLPKDLGAMLYYATEAGVPLELMNAVRTSNNRQIELAVEQALALGARKIAVFGLAFKPGTDDLRESPAVPLVKRLIGEGKELKIFDRYVNQARLMGTNLEYIRRHIPHFEALLVADPEKALNDAELVIVTNGTPEFRAVLEKAKVGTRILDLAGIYGTAPEGMEYYGSGW